MNKSLPRALAAECIGTFARVFAGAGAIWIYIVAPLLGAALGVVTYQFVRGEPSPALEVRREIAG